ncbi:hypothetical protein TSUD_389620 [Trifolium subterraneum]|uniref:Serine-threonine/tyrosine-protein kinase catalytic domain-containing protein n=1 Tax=Trifolium subterraneum TaxID=3900 RepID=A0A2Z6NUT5_TRISU|nr:hypothetical protein TSUD_389620 [Trifolium subterraneum]
MDLSGTLVSELGDLPNLQSLALYNNNITGTIPKELGNLTNLESLDLYLNNLSGTIPDTLGKLQKLRFLRLNNNTLTGRIPISLTNISTLQVLDLSSNNLEGDVPENGSFLLFTPVSYHNNPHLKQPTIIPAPLSPPSPASSGSSNTGVIAGGVAVGAALMFAAPAIALIYWRRKRKPQDHFYDVPEVEMISMAVHRNLLRLCGFCMTSTERLLVYPLMANGSVASCLRAPEYLSTGKSSEKTDVFGYGVTLLELITGQRAFDLARLASDDDVMLLDWVKGLLTDKKLETLVDPELKGDYDDDEVEQLFQVALLCTQGSPMERPKMSEVVRMLEGDGLVEKWEQWQKEETYRQDFSNNRMHYPNANWIVVDSTSNIHPDELSGPR